MVGQFTTLLSFIVMTSCQRLLEFQREKKGIAICYIERCACRSGDVDLEKSKRGRHVTLGSRPDRVRLIRLALHLTHQVLGLYPLAAQPRDTSSRPHIPFTLPESFQLSNHSRDWSSISILNTFQFLLSSSAGSGNLPQKKPIKFCPTAVDQMIASPR